jgi:hypothetical protein
MAKAVELMDRLHNMIYIGTDIEQSYKLIEQGSRRFNVLKISKEPSLCIDSVYTGERYEGYAKLLEHLPLDQPRYATFNLTYKTPNDQIRDKMFFILWCPDSCDVKSRMIYASFFIVLKRFLQAEGVSEIQANEPDEVEYNTVCTKLLDEVCEELVPSPPLLLQRLSKVAAYRNADIFCFDNSDALATKSRENQPVEEEEIVIDELQEKGVAEEPAEEIEIEEPEDEDLAKLIYDLTIVVERLERIAGL